MKDLIRRINPPGILKPNRGAVFATIGTIFDTVKGDAEKAFYAHFPYLADMSKLQQHGKALSIPRFVYDSDEEYRKRVAAAAFYYTHAGERSYTITQLQEHFGNRYDLIESFLHIQVKVTDFTDDDKLWLRTFLDSTLNPNISIALTEWFYFTEQVVMEDIPGIALVRQDQDLFPRGLRYDGRIRYDHGAEIRFDGSGTYNGSWTYKRISAQKGTVSDLVYLPEMYTGVRTYGGEILYTGATAVWAPEAIPNPAYYGSGTDDDAIVMQVQTALVDHAELYPAYDRRLSYDGSITYGGIQPDMLDAAAMQITQRVSDRDTVEMEDETSSIAVSKVDRDIYPSGLRYDGRITYDHGIAPLFDGNGHYDGDVRYDTVTAKPGTVLDSIYGDIPAIAYYNSTSGEQDMLSDTVTIQSFEDNAAIQPSFDGTYAYKGAVTYGSDLPPLIDGDMALTIIKHITYDGKRPYAVTQYDGSMRYAGSAVYLAGETYSGNKAIKEAA